MMEFPSYLMIFVKMLRLGCQVLKSVHSLCIFKEKEPPWLPSFPPHSSVSKTLSFHFIMVSNQIFHSGCMRMLTCADVYSLVLWQRLKSS